MCPEINDDVEVHYYDKDNKEVGHDKTHNGVIVDYSGVSGDDPSVDHATVKSETTVKQTDDSSYTGDAVKGNNNCA